MRPEPASFCACSAPANRVERWRDGKQHQAERNPMALGLPATDPPQHREKLPGRFREQPDRNTNVPLQQPRAVLRRHARGWDVAGSSVNSQVEILPASAPTSSKQYLRARAGRATLGIRNPYCRHNTTSPRATTRPVTAVPRVLHWPIYFDHRSRTQSRTSPATIGARRNAASLAAGLP